MNRLTKHSALVRVILALSLAAGCKSSTEPRNDPPTAHITQPTGVLTVAESAAVIFKGNASDPEDGALSGASLAWSSNLNGALGTGDSIQITTLSAGNQVVTLTATDSKGITATATVSLTVTPFVPGNQPPQVTISAPAPGAVVTQGAPVTFTGSAIDPEDGALTGAALAWSSSLDGPLGTGTSITTSGLSLGQHQITLTATDNGSLSASATLTLTVTVVQILSLDTVATGLSKPVFLTYPPGDTQRLFVVEQTGVIRIIKNGILLPAAFLDITDSVTKGDEQGLLGLAFAPNYATSGRFFVSYTAPRGGNAGHAVIARYQVSANADLADPNSAVVILTQDDPYDNHNGGMIAFGPDTYFYFGLGDGGGGGDPLNSGQNPNDFFASILRLDVSGNTYTIPPTNPFANSATAAHEVWSYGLRNPWRWSFDRQTGDLYIGDVGQNALEEVDVQAAASPGGENYGWNIMEGFSCYGGGTCNQTGLKLPVLDYTHSDGCAVVGGYVYRGSALPSITGQYFYSDNCTSFIRSFHWTGTGITDEKDWPNLAISGNVSSFGEDAAGELYIVDLGGNIFKVVAQ
jgi:glucose/arabinose dehydrogenase